MKSLGRELGQLGAVFLGTSGIAFTLARGVLDSGYGHCNNKQEEAKDGKDTTIAGIMQRMKGVAPTGDREIKIILHSDPHIYTFSKVLLLNNNKALH